MTLRKKAATCSAVLTWVLGSLLLGCGTRSTRPAASGLAGAPSTYEHTLAVGYSSVCELRNTELRCAGLHRVAGPDASAWISHGTGFDGFSHTQVANCGIRAGRPICWSDALGDDDVSDDDDASMPLCSPQTFSDRTDVRELRVMGDGGCVRSVTGDVDCWGMTIADESDERGAQRVVSGAQSMSVNEWGGCAITETGLVCWGTAPLTATSAEAAANEEAPGSSEPRAVQVPDAVQVVTGGEVACARTEAGRVYCWGAGRDGELGRGPSAFGGPLAFPDLLATDLTAGFAAFCARTADERSFCWGDNHLGQLGVGHTRRVDRPTHVPALDGALDVALGDRLTCARFEGGELRCVGDLLDLAGETPTVPMQRMRVAEARAVVITDGSICLLTPDGARCFGGAGREARGHQEASEGWTPAFAHDATVQTFFAYGGNVCVRHSDGRLRCDFRAHEPFELLGTRALTGSGTVACAVTADGAVLCWSMFGEPETRRLVPGVTDAEHLEFHWSRSCAVLTSGALRCWTSNTSGEPLAGPLSAVTDARSVALGSRQACVLHRGGALSCWDGMTAVPHEITGVTAIVNNQEQMWAVQAGAVHRLELRFDRAWLGDAVEGVTDVADLVEHDENLCARTRAGEVWCWGSNTRAQLGQLPSTLRLAFTPLPTHEGEPFNRLSSECGVSYQDEDEDYEDYSDDYEEDEDYGDEDY